MAELVDAADSKSAVRKDVQVRFQNKFFMYYIYAIKSTTRNYIYVGITNNLERRLDEHNRGLNRTTKPYMPFVLICTETVASRLEARKREIYLKSGVGKEFLKGLLK